MSVVRKDFVKVVGQQIGLDNIPDEVAGVLATDVEFRIHRLIEESLRFTVHSRRQVLKTEDINDALRCRSEEALYGFSGLGPRQYVPMKDAEGLYFVEDKDVDLSELLAQTVPECPIETSFDIHWLSIDGVQPKIPENDMENTDGSGRSLVQTDCAVVKPLVKHVLSQELQLYFDKVTEAILSGKDTELGLSALHSLRTDPGLQQLMPYFVKFFGEEVAANLSELEKLEAIMEAADCLLSNPTIRVEFYLHQILPPVLTCVVTRKLGGLPLENHWDLRERAAGIAASIVRKHGDTYTNLQPRIAKTYAMALNDSASPLPTQYGAILGIFHLGNLAVEKLIVPRMFGLVRRLEKILDVSNAFNAAEAKDSDRVTDNMDVDTGEGMTERSGGRQTSAGRSLGLKHRSEAMATKIEAQNCMGALARAIGLYVRAELHTTGGPSKGRVSASGVKSSVKREAAPQSAGVSASDASSLPQVKEEKNSVAPREQEMHVSKERRQVMEQVPETFGDQLLAYVSLPQVLLV